MLPERLVFVDLETAGLEPWRPVMQIAAVAVDRRLQEVDWFEAKIRFSHLKADPASLRKAKYEPRTWARQGLSDREAAEAFATFLRRHATMEMEAPNGGRYRVAQLVAHNAAFDGAFLRHWFDRLGFFLPGHYRILCTVQRAIWWFQEDPNRRPPVDFKLGTLCRHFGVRLTAKEAHDALNDVRATVKLYRALTCPGRKGPTPAVRGSRGYLNARCRSTPKPGGRVDARRSYASPIRGEWRKPPTTKNPPARKRIRRRDDSPPACRWRRDYRGRRVSSAS